MLVFILMNRFWSKIYMVCYQLCFEYNWVGYNFSIDRRYDVGTPQSRLLEYDHTNLVLNSKIEWSLKNWKESTNSPIDSNSVNRLFLQFIRIWVFWQKRTPLLVTTFYSVKLVLPSKLNFFWYKNLFYW